MHLMDTTFYTDIIIVNWLKTEIICLGWTLSKSSCVSCMIDVICSTGRINGNTPVSITELTDKHSQFQNTGFHY